MQTNVCFRNRFPKGIKDTGDFLESETQRAVPWLSNFISFSLLFPPHSRASVFCEPTDVSDTENLKLPQSPCEGTGPSVVSASFSARLLLSKQPSPDTRKSVVGVRVEVGEEILSRRFDQSCPLLYHWWAILEPSALTTFCTLPLYSPCPLTLALGCRPIESDVMLL